MWMAFWTKQQISYNPSNYILPPPWYWTCIPLQQILNCFRIRPLSVQPCPMTNSKWGPGVQATKLLSSTLSLLSAFLARYEIRPGEGPIVVRLADGEENSLALQRKSTISFSIVRTTEGNRGQQRTAEYYFCALISPNFAMLNGPWAQKGLKVRVLCQGQKGGGRGGDRSRPYWRGAVLWCQDYFRGWCHSATVCCVEQPFTCVWVVRKVRCARWFRRLSLVSPVKQSVEHVFWILFW